MRASMMVGGGLAVVAVVAASVVATGQVNGADAAVGEPPGAPRELSVSPNPSPDDVRLEWLRSTDDKGIDRYVLWRNGVVIDEFDDADTITTVSQQRGVTVSLPDQPGLLDVHWLQLQAVDVDGNTSAKTAPVEVVVDQDPPSAPTFVEVEPIDVDSTVGLEISFGLVQPDEIETCTLLRNLGPTRLDTFAPPTPDGSGRYRVVEPDPPAGVGSYQLFCTDAVGNDSVRSAPVAISVSDGPGCRINGAVVATVADQAECDALVSFYVATGGPDWSRNTGWNTATDPCTWNGVACNANGIQRISLTANRLSGTIPAAVGDLVHLEFLTLNSNQVSGSIPPDVGNLTNLVSLNVQRNRLSGSIPAELGGLTDLRNLVLSENQLSGSIPAELGNLTNLGFLTLGGNQLTGTIPGELGNLTNLGFLRLGSNQLSGNIPAELGNLTGLGALDLSFNELSGSIPPELGNLTSLDLLRLTSNELRGDVTAAVGGLIDTLDASVFSLADGPGGNDCLFSTDSNVTNWLDDNNPGWDRCDDPT